VSHRRYIVRRFGAQLIVALMGIACAFLAPALALSIFVALPIVFALTYHRGTTNGEDHILKAIRSKSQARDYTLIGGLMIRVVWMCQGETDMGLEISASDG